MCSLITIICEVASPVFFAVPCVPPSPSPHPSPPPSPSVPYPFTMIDNGQTWCCGMPDCSKQIPTTKKSLIVYHRNTHCPKYKCLTCGELFPQKSTMETHVRTVHTGEKPYACTCCDRAFPQLSNLQDHVRKHHTVASISPTEGSVATSPAAQAAKRYAAFREKETPVIQAEYPTWSYPQVTSEVARRWRSMKQASP